MIKRWIVFLLLFSCNVSIFAQWENLGEHFSESWVVDFEVLNDTLYILNQNGMYFLDDNNEWVLTNELEYIHFNDILDIYKDNVVIISPLNRHIAIPDSVNKTWTYISSNYYYTFNNMVISGENIIGINDSILVSTDLGKTFVNKSDQIGNDVKVSTIHKSKTCLYAGAWGRVFISEDNGITWFNSNQIGLPERSYIHSIISTSDQKLYCSTDFGLYYSEDGSKTWKQIKNEFSFHTGNVIRKLFAGKDKIYGISGNHIYAFDIDLNGIPYRQMYIPSTYPVMSVIEYNDDLYVGSNDGVYKFNNGEEDAENFSRGLEMIPVVNAFGNSDSCMLGVYYRLNSKNYKDLIVSYDFGESWNVLGSDWDNIDEYYFNVVALGNEIFTIEGNKLIHTIDFGKTWDTVLTLIPTTNTGTLFSTNGSLYLKTYDELGVWVSHDRGESWKYKSFPYDIDRITKTDSVTIILDFLARRYTKVYISFDDLETYQEAPFHMPEYMTGKGTATPFNNSWILGTNRYFYASCGENIYRSFDAGHNWDTTTEEVVLGISNKIEPYEFFADSIMIGIRPSESKHAIYYSYDLGINWKVIKTPENDTMFINETPISSTILIKIFSAGEYLFYSLDGVVYRLHSSYILNNDVPITPVNLIKDKVKFKVNTVNNKVNISFLAKDRSLMSTEVLNVQGRKIYGEYRAIQAGQNNISLPLSNVASGCYLLKLQIGNKTHTQKINFY